MTLNEQDNLYKLKELACENLKATVNSGDIDPRLVDVYATIIRDIDDELKRLNERPFTHGVGITIT